MKCPKTISPAFSLSMPFPPKSESLEYGEGGEYMLLYVVVLLGVHHALSSERPLLFIFRDDTLIS